MSIVGLLGQTASTILNGVRMLREIDASQSPIEVEELRVGYSYPKRIVTGVPINPDLMPSSKEEMYDEERYRDTTPIPLYAGSGSVWMRLHNRALKRTSIRSIFVKKRPIAINPQGSLMYVAEGGEGEVLRFSVDLDSDRAALMKDGWRDGKLVPAEGPYFDTSSIEVEPDGIRNIAIDFSCSNRAYQCEIWLRIGGKESIVFQVNPNDPFGVVPIESVPKAQRYWAPPWHEPSFIIPEDTTSP